MLGTALSLSKGRKPRAPASEHRADQQCATAEHGDRDDALPGRDGGVTTGSSQPRHYAPQASAFGGEVAVERGAVEIEVGPLPFNEDALPLLAVRGAMHQSRQPRPVSIRDARGGEQA